MPYWIGKLDDVTIASLAAYVQGLRRRRPAVGPVAPVESMTGGQIPEIGRPDYRCAIVVCAVAKFRPGVKGR